MRRLSADDRKVVMRAAQIAADAYQIFRPLIFTPTRGKLRVATARQIAMYLAHVTGQISMYRLTQAFRRDFSTISHNIRKVEDARDDAEFDAMLSQLEEVLHV